MQMPFLPLVPQKAFGEVDGHRGSGKTLTMITKSTAVECEAHVVHNFSKVGIHCWYKLYWGQYIATHWYLNKNRKKPYRPVKHVMHSHVWHLRLFRLISGYSWMFVLSSLNTPLTCLSINVAPHPAASTFTTPQILNTQPRYKLSSIELLHVLTRRFDDTNIALH